MGPRFLRTAIFQWIPIVSSFRVPGRYLFCAFPWAIFLMVDGIEAYKAHPVWNGSKTIFSVGSLVLCVISSFFAPRPDPAFVAATASLCAFVLLYVTSVRKDLFPKVGIVILLVVSLDLWYQHGAYYRTTPLSRFEDLGFNPKEGRFFSIDSDLKYQSQAPMHRKYHVAGYDPMVPKDYNRFLNAASGRDLTDNQAVFFPTRFPERLGIAAARWIISDRPLGSDRLVPFGKQGRTLVYENPDALPRFFFVASLTKVDREQIWSKMRDEPMATFRNTALIHEAKASQSYETGKDPPQLIFDRGDEIQIRLKPSPHARFLVLSDNFYPGWRAYADAREIPIERVNGYMKGVEIPPRVTTLDLDFSPVGAAAGRYTTLGFSMFVAGVLLITGRRSKKMPQPEREKVADRP